MKEIKVKVYTAWEAIRPYITEKYLKKEWGEELKNVDLTDDYSIAEFLEIVENDTGAVKLLTDEQKEVLGLNDLFDENHFYYLMKTTSII